jgi:hypothetical protein
MAEAAIPRDLSIHPRNWRDVPGFGPGTNNKKRHTAKPQKRTSKKSERKRAWLNARRNDAAQTKTKHPAAYRMPGSMNDGK